MTFDEITSDTDCELLEGTIEDYDSVYCHKIKYNSLRGHNDFRSYWEREDRRPNAHPDDCKSVRRQKAVSIDKYTEENFEDILDRYRSAFGCTRDIAPGVQAPHCCKFQLNEEAGKVKPTPSRSNPHHHSFFKSDQFTKSDSISVIEIVPLGED